MRYALIENGAVKTYPYTLALLKAGNPEVSFPRDPSRIRIEDFGVVEVANVAPPAASSVFVDVVEGVPILVDGSWRQTWKEVAASPETIARRQRETEDEAIRAQAKAEAFVQAFVSMTPAEVAAHVETSVTNISSAKVLLKHMAVMMLLMARREFGE